LHLLPGHVLDRLDARRQACWSGLLSLLHATEALLQELLDGVEPDAVIGDDDLMSPRAQAVVASGRHSHRFVRACGCLDENALQLAQVRGSDLGKPRADAGRADGAVAGPGGRHRLGRDLVRLARKLVDRDTPGKRRAFPRLARLLASPKGVRLIPLRDHPGVADTEA
jgi:hypothetical protein